MQALPVQVQQVTEQQVPQFTEYVATIVSRGSAVVQPMVEGHIVRLFVRAGQQVRAGEKIAQIDPGKQQATVNSQAAATDAQQAKLQLDKVNLQRTQQLFSSGVVAKQDLDNAQATYNADLKTMQSLEAGTAVQQEQLRYYSVEAPVNGVVGDLPYRVGDYVTTTTAMTTVDSGSGLEAYIYLPADKAGQVKVGTPVQLFGDSNTEVDSKIYFVSPRVDTTNQLLLVKAALPQGSGFTNQQIVHARVVWEYAKAVLVNVLDVSRQSSDVFAFVVAQKNGADVAEQRAITTGEVVGNDYVVTKGLNPGDQLIVSGVQMLSDGMPIKPLKQDAANQSGAPAASASTSTPIASDTAREKKKDNSSRNKIAEGAHSQSGATNQ